jgi:hypothetical protein
VLEKSIECDFGLVSLKDISVKLRETTGLNVGYRTDLVQKKIVKNKIFMGLGEMPVAQALDEIALRFGFAKWDLEKGRGIWFRGEAEDPYPPSGEVPWHGTVVRAYPLGELVGQRDPDEIVRTVREVCGRSSPGALVEYSRGTGKLLVIEEPAMIERVEEYLRIAVLAARATKTP